MNATIRFLGTGGAFVNPAENAHNNALLHLQDGEDQTFFLIDCGATAPQALKELGVPLLNIDKVLLTHLHGGHCGGFEQLVWERKYSWMPEEQKLSDLGTNLICHPDLVDDVDNHYAPIFDYYVRHGEVMEHNCNEAFDLVPLEAVVWKGFTLRFVLVRHLPPETPECPELITKWAFGITLEHKDAGPLMFYTGDTRIIQPGDKDWDAMEAAPVIFHDCTFAPPYPGTVHAHYDEMVEQYPEEIRRKIMLMHYGTQFNAERIALDEFKGAAVRNMCYSL